MMPQLTTAQAFYVAMNLHKAPNLRARLLAFQDEIKKGIEGHGQDTKVWPPELVERLHQDQGILEKDLNSFLEGGWSE